MALETDENPTDLLPFWLALWPFPLVFNGPRSSRVEKLFRDRHRNFVRTPCHSTILFRLIPIFCPFSPIFLLLLSPKGKFRGAKLGNWVPPILPAPAGVKVPSALLPSHVDSSSHPPPTFRFILFCLFQFLMSRVSSFIPKREAPSNVGVLRICWS